MKTCVSEKDQNRLDKRDSPAEIPCDKDLWGSRKHFSGVGFRD